MTAYSQTKYEVVLVYDDGEFTHNHGSVASCDEEQTARHIRTSLSPTKATRLLLKRSPVADERGNMHLRLRKREIHADTYGELYV